MRARAWRGRAGRRRLRVVITPIGPPPPGFIAVNGEHYSFVRPSAWRSMEMTSRRAGGFESALGAHGLPIQVGIGFAEGYPNTLEARSISPRARANRLPRYTSPASARSRAGRRAVPHRLHLRLLRSRRRPSATSTSTSRPRPRPAEPLRPRAGGGLGRGERQADHRFPGGQMTATLAPDARMFIDLRRLRGVGGPVFRSGSSSGASGSRTRTRWTSTSPRTTTRTRTL